MSIVEKTDAKIREELYRAMKSLGAQSDLLSIVGSWGDTMDDEWVLNALRDWNERQAFTRRGLAD